MKKVIIKVGGYGYRPDKDSAVQLITEKDGPISVSDEEAARLVGLKVAVLAEDTVVESPAPVLTEAETEETATGHLDADSLREYTVPELKDLAKKLGLKAGGTKDELIERIAATEVEYPVADEDAEDDEEPPVLEAADPE